MARLGAFIVVTLAVLAARVRIIGSKEYLFSSTYQLKAQFEDAAALTVGADVQVGGVHNGTVRRIELPDEPDGKVTAVVDLDKSTHKIVRQNLVALNETEGVLGSQYPAISFGSAGQTHTINCRSPSGIIPRTIRGRTSLAAHYRFCLVESRWELPITSLHPAAVWPAALRIPRS